jgi:deoxyribodipyrimidine photolyase
LFKELGIDVLSSDVKLSDLVQRDHKVTTSFKGGETEAKRILKEYLKDKKKVLEFQKPYTMPTTLTPSTTALSPYLKFGCLSVR